MSTDSVPRPRQRAQTHGDASAYWWEWAETLTQHKELQGDIEQCHRAFDAWIAGRARGPHRVASQHLYLLSAEHYANDFFLSHLAGWPRARFAALWAKAPALLDTLLEPAISHGSWQYAVQRVSNHTSQLGWGVRVTVFNDPSALRPPWQGAAPGMWSEIGPGDAPIPSRYIPQHLAIVLHLPFGPGTREAAHAALDRVWPEQIAPKLPPERGGRGAGNKKSAPHNMRLYALWCAHPTAWQARRDLWDGRTTITWPEFHDLVKESGLFTHHETARTTESATTKALCLLAPAPAAQVAPTLADYLKTRSTRT